MRNRFIGTHLDFFGFLASMLCAVHCAALPLVLTIGALGGLHWISDPVVEYGFIVISLVIASATMLMSYRKGATDGRVTITFLLGFGLILTSLLLPHTHGIELVFKILGGTTIALAHILHWLGMKRRTVACVC